MISMLAVCFAAGISMAVASPHPCEHSGGVGGTSKIPDAPLCVKMGGYCYDERCDKCDPIRINRFLCGGDGQGPKFCCLPRPQDRAFCQYYGDPHVRTFDGYNYDIQKDGTFNLVEGCDGKDLEFGITGEFFFPTGVTRYTLVKSVTVTLDSGATATITNGPPLSVTVNGSPVTTFPKSVGPFKITKIGSVIYITIKTLGIQICFDGNMVKIWVDTRWLNKLCGACGRYNNDCRDEVEESKKVATVDDQCPEIGTPETRLLCRDELKKVLKNCTTEHIHIQKFLNDCARDECVEPGASKFTLDALKGDCDPTGDEMFEELRKEEEEEGEGQTQGGP